ncbi:hypothetical protein GLOIN_2v1869233 [Rhizophagus clarus]|uniref:SbsA Ig-like domain-containing protein n=1 Tax=Rhizophagus clarus TaxID=94130 RepID=A0A8H3QNR1_9GLOM|nr:hypothetical protein GLOIN_2v1869233 [Rhizophagus clarus]
MNLKYRFSIFLSIILLTTLLVKSNSITYTKEVIGSGKLEVKEILTYEDNTIVLRIIYMLLPYGDCNETNFETNLSFRVIYPNGTIKPIDLSMDELRIQPLNFCLVDSSAGHLDPITPYAIETTKGKFILVTYTVAADINNLTTYNDYVMLMDLYGNIHSTTLLGPSRVIDNLWLPRQGFIVPNVDNDRGFLYSSIIHEKDDLSLSNITAEIILPQLPNQTKFLPTATVDGNYIIICTNSTSSANLSEDPFSIQGGVYAIYFEYKSNISRKPVILYQTTNPLNISAIECRISYSGVGHVCLLSLQPNSISNSTTPLFIKVNFLSQGTVFNVTTTTNVTNPIFGIMSLRFGGFFYYFYNLTDTASFIWGYVLDDNDNLHNWTLNYPTKLNYYAVRQVLTSNIVVMAQPTVNQTWSLITADLYKIHEDNGYNNVLINTTTPTIGDTITADKPHFLIITYTIPVRLSDGNITIFQSNGISNPGIVRQIINGIDGSRYGDYRDYIRFNNNTVNVTIINSTFNNPGSTYYVIIGNGFVTSQEYNEPLYGLSSNVWSFKMEKEKENKNKIESLFDSVDGIVRLTSDGTKEFDSFIKLNKKNEIFNNLKRELANAVIVTTERITTSYRFVIDTSLPRNSPKQYLLSINIDKPQIETERPTDLIINDLDVMIRNITITALASGNVSKYLDPDFGYRTFPGWFEENKSKIITVPIGLLALTLLCFYSIYKENDGKNVKDGNIIKFIIIRFFSEIKKSARTESPLNESKTKMQEASVVFFCKFHMS